MTDSQKIELRISVPCSNACARLPNLKATAYSEEIRAENRTDYKPSLASSKNGSGPA